MPLYEYYCSTCELKFEALANLADHDKPAECPNCNNEAHRIISATAFILKGSGWGRDCYSSSPDKSCKRGINKKDVEKVAKK